VHDGLCPSGERLHQARAPGIRLLISPAHWLYIGVRCDKQAVLSPVSFGYPARETAAREAQYLLGTTDNIVRQKPL
jgi:hypothetical protein